MDGIKGVGVIMAGSVNKVILIGNVGRDPETRMSQDGAKIVNFSLATSESWKDKVSGEKKDRVEWHRIVVFNPNLAEICEKYLHKGSRVYVEGQLQTRKWKDQAGVEKYTTEVILGRFRGDVALLDSRSADGVAAAAFVDEGSEPIPVGDDIPF
jgi:single-strand DNA-binding protein